MLTEKSADDDIAELADELGQPCWRDLIEKDDRTSPEEYPDHALISQDELIEYIKVSLDMAACPDALLKLLARPIETAPELKEVLVFWPLRKLDDDGNLTDEPVFGKDGKPEGAWLVSEKDGTGRWEEPDVLNAMGEWFGDDCEYAEKPTHWSHLPATPSR